MLSHSSMFRLFVLVQTLFLFACTGDDAKNLPAFNDFYELKLASLEVVEGGTLYYDGEEVEEFDNTQLNLYSIVLDDQASTSITLRASAVDSANRITIIERRKGSNNSDLDTPLSSESGEFSVQVNEGTNIVLVRVTSADGIAQSDYTIQIDRVSSEAKLREVILRPVGFPSNQGFSTVPAAFDSNISDYTITIPTSSCGVEIVAPATQAKARTRINGIGNGFAAVHFLNFSMDSEIKQWACAGSETLIETPAEQTNAPVCQNNESATLRRTLNRVLVEVDVTAEDGEQTRNYNLTFERARTSEDIAVEGLLAEITVANSRSTTPFRCESDRLQFNVSYSVTSTTLTALAMNAGTDLRIAKAVLDPITKTPSKDSQLGIWRAETSDAVPLESGTPGADDLLSELVVGDNYFVVLSSPADVVPIQSYLINIFRSARNLVFVESAEELQTALENAQSNDEIILTEGNYTREPEEILGARSVFHSSASGTQDQPIILRGEGTTRLHATGLTQDAVLTLSGDNWQLFGLEFGEAQTGLMLNGASNTKVYRSRFDNLGKYGLVINNDGSNNRIFDSRFNQIGLLMPEDESAIGNEAIAIESGSANTIEKNTFGRDIAGYAINIKGEAEGTKVRYNQFSSDNTLPQPFPERAVVLSQGNGTEISYNDFAYRHISLGENPISYIVAVDTAEADETATEVYQNLFALDDQAIDLAGNLGGGSLRVADNRRLDNQDISYHGDVDSDFVTPTWQIQSTLNATRCLSKRAVDDVINGQTETRNFAALDNCSPEETQRWQFVNDGKGFVTIRSLADPADKITFNGSRLAVRRDTGDVFDQGGALRWQIVHDLDKVSLINKANALLAYENPEAEFNPGTPIRPVEIGTPTNDSTIHFRLIRQD